MGGIGTIRYKVAEAARLAGVSASTLRLWETQGLVVPERSVTGHRQYTDADLARLKRISWFRSERGLNPAAIRRLWRRKAPSPKTKTARQCRPKTMATCRSGGSCAV